MYQEIITYIIVSVAVALAAYKIIKYLKGKNRKKKTGCRKGTIPTEELCTNCLEDCEMGPLINKKEKTKICEINPKGL